MSRPLDRPPSAVKAGQRIRCPECRADHAAHVVLVKFGDEAPCIIALECGVCGAGFQSPHPREILDGGMVTGRMRAIIGPRDHFLN